MSIAEWRAFSVICCVLLAAPATQAQVKSVQAVFEQYKLLGTFAGDCSAPASKQNPYGVFRVVDSNRVQYDLMTGPNDQANVGVIDTAAAQGPNEIRLEIAGKRGRINLIYRVEDNRFRLLTSTRQSGETLVVNGRFMPENVETPWVNQCG